MKNHGAKIKVSDKRIKKDIQDVLDDDCLVKLRLLQG